MRDVEGESLTRNGGSEGSNPEARGGETTHSLRIGSLRQDCDDGVRASAVEKREGTDHAERQHRVAMLSVERERSTMTLPSFSTVDRIDAEGEGLLHRGGTSGGVYDSYRTMEDVSGADEIFAAKNHSDASQEDGLSSLFVDDSRDGNKPGYNGDQAEKSLRVVNFSDVCAGAKTREGGKGVEMNGEELGTNPRPQRRKSLASSILSTLSATYSKRIRQDGRDETKQSGWKIMRRRKMSIVVKGKRLSDTPKGNFEDETEELERRRDYSEQSEALSEQAGGGSRRASQEILLEEAQKEKKKFEIRPGECMIAMIAYLGLSILAFSFVFEHWSCIDSLYFAVVTFTTTGYGDFSPSTTPGRLFCCFYALGGVSALGIALGVLGDKLVESEMQAIKLAETSRRKKIMDALNLAGEHGSQRVADSTAGQKNSAAKKGTRVHCRFRFMPFPLVSAFLVIGTVFISVLEGWNWSSGLYYTVITMCTIGFGDYTPELPLSRAFAVFFIPFSVAFAGAVLGKVANYVIEERQRKFRSELLKFDLTFEALEAMDSTGSGRVTWDDFLVFMLLAMGKVDRDLIDDIHGHFERLDETNSGDLSIEDLKVAFSRNLGSVRKKLELAEYKRKILTKASGEPPPPP